MTSEAQPRLAGVIDAVTDALQFSSASQDSICENSIGAIRGWAVFLDDPTSCTGAFFSIDGSPFLEVAYGYSREDVAETLGESRFATCGFSGLFSTRDLAIGRHFVEIALRDAHGHYFKLLDKFAFDIKSMDSFVGQKVIGDVDQAARRWHAATGTTLGNIDEAIVLGEDRTEKSSDNVRVRRGSTLFFRGWAIDESRAAPASAVKLWIDGITFNPTVYGLDREDVALAFESSSYTKSGFVGLLETDNLSTGVHRISMRVASESGEVFDAATTLSIVVEEPTAEPDSASST